MAKEKIQGESEPKAKKKYVFPDECEAGQICLSNDDRYDYVKLNNKFRNEFLVIPKIHSSLVDEYPILKTSREDGCLSQSQTTSSSVRGLAISFKLEQHVTNMLAELSDLNDKYLK
jgi:hypothetical protein